MANLINKNKRRQSTKGKTGNVLVLIENGKSRDLMGKCTVIFHKTTKYKFPVTGPGSGG